MEKIVFKLNKTAFPLKIRFFPGHRLGIVLAWLAALAYLLGIGKKKK